jgi:hypothetical protein
MTLEEVFNAVLKGVFIALILLTFEVVLVALALFLQMLLATFFITINLAWCIVAVPIIFILIIYLIPGEGDKYEV